MIVPSFTFFATASAVTRLGAKPVWVDIDPITFNIDPALIESASEQPATRGTRTSFPGLSNLAVSPIK